MHIKTLAACEEIDAGFFSSDEFENPKDLLEIKKYVERWNRQIAVIENTLQEENFNRKNP